MLRSLVFAALIALPAIASAQDKAAQTDPNQPVQRIRSVTLTPGQKCPPSQNGDIVVCSTLNEPYRIPKSLRDDKPIPAQNQSWVNRAASLDDLGRRAGGLPDTCSAVGTGGQSGCALQQNRDYAADRRAQAAAAAAIP